MENRRIEGEPIKSRGDAVRCTFFSYTFYYYFYFFFGSLYAVRMYRTYCDCNSDAVVSKRRFSLASVCFFQFYMLTLWVSGKGGKNVYVWHIVRNTCNDKVQHNTTYNEISGMHQADFHLYWLKWLVKWYRYITNEWATTMVVHQVTMKHVYILAYTNLESGILYTKRQYFSKSCFFFLLLSFIFIIIPKSVQGVFFFIIAILENKLFCEFTKISSEFIKIMRNFPKITRDDHNYMCGRWWRL